MRTSEELAAEVCPTEIAVLLDHAMESGIQLSQWDGQGDFVRPVLAGARVREGSTFSEAAETWTVDVVVVGTGGALMEFRPDESRWVGFRFGMEGIWRRFYEGPTL